ncbi:MAG: DUF72 domain-containing protein [Deferrisomatales bacterium]
MTPRAYVGTSGWHYDHWEGPFYPSGLPPAQRLPYYAARFSTVEINGTFYRLPEASTFAAWRNSVPEGFVFAVKASRYLTHMKKLKDAEGAAATFLERAGTLGGKLGPILFQLPPRWRADPGRLRRFLHGLPRGIRCAFEFRDPSWFDPAVYRVLEERGCALCVYEFDRRISPTLCTAAFGYLRLHGPAGAYRGRYGERGLEPWAALARRWLSEGRDVYCYFDNDEAGYAVQDASTLRALLGQG